MRQSCTAPVEIVTIPQWRLRGGFRPVNCYYLCRNISTIKDKILGKPDLKISLGFGGDKKNLLLLATPHLFEVLLVIAPIFSGDGGD
jgi:hypothetical protein